MKTLKILIITFAVFVLCGFTNNTYSNNILAENSNSCPMGKGICKKYDIRIEYSNSTNEKEKNNLDIVVVLQLIKEEVRNNKPNKCFYVYGKKQENNPPTPTMFGNYFCSEGNEEQSAGLSIDEDEELSFFISKNDWDTLFIDNERFPEKIIRKIEDDVNAKNDVYLTVEGSITDKTYDNKESIDSPYGAPELKEKFDNVYNGTEKNLDIHNISFCEVCHEENGTKIVNGVLKGMQIVGYIIYIVKLVIPLLLIILASVDFTKAVFESTEKPNADVINKLIKRVITAAIIFLIPTILNFLLGLIDEVGTLVNDSESNFTNCTDCLLDPLGNCQAKDITDTCD